MMPTSTVKQESKKASKQEKKKKRQTDKKDLLIYERNCNLTDTINTCWKQSPNGKVKKCGL